jgi:stage II sporulation protein P
VEAMLDAHKDIGFVIDLHRDAFLYEDGTRLSCTCTVDGEKAAQIMLVVGTDASGLYHPSWRDNLDFAVALQQELENANPGITRPIDLRTQRFNQHVSKGALIVELGASGNTLGEALRSVPVLAEAIAAVLTEQSGC